MASGIEIVDLINCVVAQEEEKLLNGVRPCQTAFSNLYSLCRNFHKTRKLCSFIERQIEEEREKRRRFIDSICSK